MFRSTESENFNIDAMTTGFGAGNIRIAPARDATPVHDKNSILASKPNFGAMGKARHQLIRSPERSFNNYGGDFHSAGGLNSEMRPAVNQNELQKEIEEEIGMAEDTYEEDQRAMDQSNSKVDPNETCTSDFYQIPVQGGIPVQLTIENGGRRPFTPPFAQLVPRSNNGKPPTG